MRQINAVETLWLRPGREGAPIYWLASLTPDAPQIRD